MARDLQALLGALAIEPVAADVFHGHVPSPAGRRVFGGLFVAQALVAVSQTVEGRVPHSLHAYFLSPGDPAMPITYQVERLRDGHSFAARRCVAVQAARRIFEMTASFHVGEVGLDHAAAMPDVPSPESLPSLFTDDDVSGWAGPAGLREWLRTRQAVEVRPCALGRYNGSDGPQPTQHVWMRANGRLPDDAATHRAALAYMSDLTLIDVALAAHGRTLFEPEFAVASLDHALWFHRPGRADEWLLYAQDSPTTCGGLGLARGLIFDRGGRLVASVMQEGVIRQRRA